MFGLNSYRPYQVVIVAAAPARRVLGARGDATRRRAPVDRDDRRVRPRVPRQRLPEHRVPVPDHAGRLIGVRARAPDAREPRRALRPARPLGLAAGLAALMCSGVGVSMVDRGRRRDAARTRVAAGADAHRAARRDLRRLVRRDRPRRVTTATAPVPARSRRFVRDGRRRDLPRDGATAAASACCSRCCSSSA